MTNFTPFRATFPSMAPDHINDKISHGGALDAMKRRHPDFQGNWIDLSTGICPYSYPPLISDDEKIKWQYLPSSDLYNALQEKAAVYFSVPASHVLPIAGVQSFINILPSITAGDAIFYIRKFTYAEYAHKVKSFGKKLVYFQDFDALKNLCVPANSKGKNSPDMSAKIIIICNPNNPDGDIFSNDDFNILCNNLQPHDILIIDEAFMDLFPEKSATKLIEKYHNLIILKSFGKFFGLAGVRLGFCLATPDLLKYIAPFHGPWSPSTPAMQLGIKAYNDAPWVLENTAKILKISAIMQQILQNIGFKIMISFIIGFGCIGGNG